MTFCEDNCRPSQSVNSPESLRHQSHRLLHWQASIKQWIDETIKTRKAYLPISYLGNPSAAEIAIQASHTANQCICYIPGHQFLTDYSISHSGSQGGISLLINQSV